MSPGRALPNTTLLPSDLSRLKVLVADDHAVTARLIKDVLRAAGVIQVKTAEDGLRAREFIKAWNPHIVFVDWNMPLMDGVELTRSIRRAAVTPDRMIPNPQVPVIMLTAMRSRHREVEAARRAGVNEFVVKPFTPAALISRIQMVLMKPRPFVVADDYVGPDRRRRVELSYSGPLRRAVDPDEVMDADERQSTRATMAIELEALRGLISARGRVDRETLQMTYRVMQHTRFRARQLREDYVEQVCQLLIDYMDIVRAPDKCDPVVLEIHFDAVRTFLAMPTANRALAAKVMRQLHLAVEKKALKDKAGKAAKAS